MAGRKKQTHRKQKKREATLPEALELATRLHRGGHLDEAESIYRRVLAVEPEHPDALHFLGVLTHQTGKHAEAIGLIRRSLESFPENLDARNNLGNVLKECGKLAEAEAVYREVIAKMPEHALAYNNLGVTLNLSARLDEAEQAIRKAIELQPRYADAYHNLGNIQRAQGNLFPAIESWKRVLELEPGHAASLRNLGTALFRQGERDEAIAMFEECLRVHPTNPIALHMLAAYTGKRVPDRASDAFVREMFNGMASSFDSHLGDLKYRAPELLAQSVRRAVGEARDLVILDAGCGTGLCGPLLKPLAARMEGIDLSQAMLERASARESYDHLEAVEITRYLLANPGRYHLVIASDTFNYFGRLDPLFTAIHAALLPGGHSVFTLEHADEVPVGGFALLPHGRYAHTQAYLRQVLSDTGFEQPHFAEDVLRLEHGEPVKGMIVTVRRAEL